MSAASPPRGLEPPGARVALRDRSVSDVLDLALRFLVVHGRLYAIVALSSLVPLTCLALAAGALLQPAAAWAIAVSLAAISEIAFTVLASRLVFEDEVRTREVLAAALRAAPRVVVARALSTALVALGLVLLVVPGVWLATILLFTAEVTLLERSGLGRTLGRAPRIASAAASDALLGVLVLLLVPIASVLLADLAGRTVIDEVLLFRGPPPVWSSGWSALAAIGLFAQVPYLATARFFLYLNVRTRAEGWDIQTRFAAIAARSEHDPGSLRPSRDEAA